eukprot:15445762-Alexandrium_andersonii.AAC.1
MRQAEAFGSAMVLGAGARAGQGRGPPGGQRQGRPGRPPRDIPAGDVREAHLLGGHQARAG